MANPDISWAVNEFVGSRRLNRYAIFHAYYLGDHRLNFATEKFRSVFGTMLSAFADNLCESVVETISERLEVTGFSSNHATVEQEFLQIDSAILDKLNEITGDASVVENSGGEDTDANETPFQPVQLKPPILTHRNDPFGEAAWDLWECNGADTMADEFHKEMLITGDGFLLLWPDDVTGEPMIWPQKSHNWAVRYSTTRRGVIDVAAKFWLQPDPADPQKGNKGFLTLYYPDHIERYVTKTRIHQLSAQSITKNIFVPYNDAEGGANLRVPVEIGRVPVFHMPNKTWNRYGVSELNNVVPVQDALNKAVCDMLVAMEFSAYKQRWVTGVEVEIDEDTGKPKELPFEYGSDRMIATADPDAKFGEFQQTELEQFLLVQRDFRAEIARVTGIPLHYLFTNASNDSPSGEALKTSELRFSRKLSKQQGRLGRMWEDVMESALKLDDDGDDAAGPPPDDLDLNVLWITTSPRSESELMDVLIKKQSIGVPNTQLQKESGYDDDEVEQFAVEAVLEPDNLMANTTVAGPASAPAPGSGNPASAPKPASPKQTRSTPAQKVKDKAVPPQNQK